MSDIDFLQVPEDTRDPGQYIEIDNRNAKPGISIMPHRILYIGQMLATGTATPLVAKQLYLSDDQAKALFGRGSMLAAMWIAGGKVDKSTERWALPIADLDAGAKATGAIVFGGPATEAGTAPLMAGGRRIRWGVPSGMTAAQNATAAAAAINADLDAQIVAAVDGVDPTKVILTARHKGEEGNNIDLRFNYYDGEALPAGMTATITAMTGGTGNPDITAALAAVADKQFHTIIMPYNDAANRAVLETELASRCGPVKQMDGIAYGAKRAPQGTLATFGLSRNTEFLSTLGLDQMVDTPWETAAAYGAAMAFECRVDPAKPLWTVKLTGLKPPAEKDRFDHDARELLLHDGIAVTKVDEGGNVCVGRAITHYRANSFGLEDDSYLDSTTLRIIFYIRYDTRSMMSQKYPRAKLGDNGSRGKGVATAEKVRDQIIERAVQWEAAGLIEDLEAFKKDLVVERSTTNRSRLNARIPANVINGLATFAGQIQFIL